MEKIYVVTQLTNSMEIEDEKAFTDYEAAARYFKAILGEWLLVYLTEPDIPFERDKKRF